MAFKLNRSSKEPMSEINVTPFVDVMLVLLIIFMVTAPLLTVGVQVDPSRNICGFTSRRS
jgi:biopolymer transport protein TolR